ncbi:hypothetical protein MRX96_049765, partial [Rhipicephalus microplus]
MLTRLDTMGTNFFDVVPVVRFATFVILCEAIFGVETNEAEVQKMRLLEINDEIGASIIARMMNLFHWPNIIYCMTQASKDFKKNVNFIHEYNRQIVKQRLSDYNMDKVKVDSKKSFLDVLLHAHVVDGTLTEDEVRNEVTSIFIG